MPGSVCWFQEHYVTDQGDCGNGQDFCAAGYPDVIAMVCNHVLNTRSTHQCCGNENNPALVCNPDGQQGPDFRAAGRTEHDAVAVLLRLLEAYIEVLGGHNFFPP